VDAQAATDDARRIIAVMNIRAGIGLSARADDRCGGSTGLIRAISIAKPRGRTGFPIEPTPTGGAGTLMSVWQSCLKSSLRPAT